MPYGVRSGIRSKVPVAALHTYNENALVIQKRAWPRPRGSRAGQRARAGQFSKVHSVGWGAPVDAALGLGALGDDALEPVEARHVVLVDRSMPRRARNKVRNLHREVLRHIRVGLAVVQCLCGIALGSVLGCVWLE